MATEKDFATQYFELCAKFRKATFSEKRKLFEEFKKLDESTNDNNSNEENQKLRII